MYWLVTDDRKGPISLVRSISTTRIEVIAGESRALSGFKDGQPDLSISKPWYFEPISSHSWWPAIGDWIKKLGPVKTPQVRLRKEKERQARRERVKKLTSQELDKIVEMRGNGVAARKIAERYKIGESSVLTICRKKAA